MNEAQKARLALIQKDLDAEKAATIKSAEKRVAQAKQDLKDAEAGLRLTIKENS